MKIKQLLLVLLTGLILMTQNVGAISVNFIEGATEGSLVTVSSSGWLSAAPGGSTSESASFTGFVSPTALHGPLSGSFQFFLLEPGTGLLSDYVNVSWGPVTLPPIGTLIAFQFDFLSDAEGTGLVPPPPGPGFLGRIVTPETGALQIFPLDGLSVLGPAGPEPILVGMQSDLDQVHVPDGGMTMTLLGMVMGGLGFVRSQLRRRSHRA
jgi:hypothetical protein